MKVLTRPSLLGLAMMLVASISAYQEPGYAQLDKLYQNQTSREESNRQWARRAFANAQFRSEIREDVRWYITNGKVYLVKPEWLTYGTKSAEPSYEYKFYGFIGREHKSPYDNRLMKARLYKIEKGDLIEYSVLVDEGGRKGRLLRLLQGIPR